MKELANSNMESATLNKETKLIDWPKIQYNNYKIKI